MTAASAHPPGSEPGLSEGRASEPSMEDILASIRRIIADDQQGSGSRLAARRAPPPAVPLAEVPAPGSHDEGALDLERFGAGVDRTADTDASFETGLPHHEPANLSTDARVHHDDGDAALASRHAGPAAPMTEPDDHGRYLDPGIEHDAGDVALLAPPMGESVMSAFEALAATVVLENKPMLEGILRDLLRPMLKAWLDDNLPSMVERLVRVEIERVARGGRG